MTQPHQVKLGAFYQCYGSAPATDGLSKGAVNIAQDGWAAAERIMRYRMPDPRDQTRRERIAGILLNKTFISRELVVESIAFPKERLSLDNPSSSRDKFKSEVLVNWDELCLTQHQSGASGNLVFRPSGEIPAHATRDHAECCYPNVEITIVEPLVSPLNSRGTSRLEDRTFVASLTTFCATRLHLLQQFHEEGKMDQFYDQLMCMCLYFAAVSTCDGNVSRLGSFETTPEDWSAFERDNNLYDSESMFGDAGRWKAWDFLREHELDIEGWFQNAAVQWCPDNARDQSALVAACRAMRGPLYRLYEPIPRKLRKSIRNSPMAQSVFARLGTTPSGPSNHPLTAGRQFIPVIRDRFDKRRNRRSRW